MAWLTLASLRSDDAMRMVSEYIWPVGWKFCFLDHADRVVAGKVPPKSQSLEPHLGSTAMVVGIVKIKDPDAIWYNDGPQEGD